MHTLRSVVATAVIIVAFVCGVSLVMPQYAHAQSFVAGKQELLAQLMQQIDRLQQLLAMTTSTGRLVSATQTTDSITTVAVTGPLTVVTTDKIPCTNGTKDCVSTGRRIDAEYPTITQSTNRYWFDVNSDYMRKMSGSFSAPFTSEVWTKKTSSVFNEAEVTDPAAIRDKKWIVNTYETGTPGEVLAFIHIEREDMIQSYDGWGRVAMARSTNYGDTFTYLGYIAVPYTDPSAMNVAGVPYFIKDGYFYAYYIDRCVVAGHEKDVDPTKYTRPNIAVIRAKVSDVVTAARSGKAATWNKYFDGNWNEPGISGKCSELWQTTSGIISSDAVFSTTTNKAYMVRQLPKNASTSQPAWLSLFESSDGIKWKLTKEIVPATTSVQFGYSYQVLVGTNGENNGVVGSTFYVYSDKDAAAGPLSLGNGSILRWLVDLDPYATHTFSKEFSSTQGQNNWRYQYYNSGQHIDMAWDSVNGQWKGNETYLLLMKGGQFHPGTNSGASLTWTAPRSGTIRVTGTVKELNKNTCGDGVAVAIHKNTTPSWYADIANGDFVGVSHDKTLNVVAGDQVHFIVTRGSGNKNNQCDTVGWDPSIAYQK
jgi:hypothetical protein